MKKKLIVVLALSLIGSSVLNIPATTFADSAATSSNASQVSKVTPEMRKVLWDNPEKFLNRNVFYRIPAITTTNDGDLLAVTDARWDKADDIGVKGPQQIDLLIQSSKNNGANWSNEKNLTTKHSTKEIGYGDAAIVADRNSDKVLIVAVKGAISFPDSTRDNPNSAVTMVSEDGGKTFSPPKDITKQIYDLDPSWQGLFAASGRIMQSRYVKVGEYHRLYMAILAKNDKEINATTRGNYVLYSDDFGETWNVLGSTVSPVPNGDEAKIEELPNGNVVISSRTGQGRLINIFTYDKNDPLYKTGKWEDKHQYLRLSQEGNPTNGEILTVYARNTKTNEYTHLVLQSLPTITNEYRRGVGIFYKEVDENVSTVSQYVDGWSKANFHLIQKGSSAYSTMTIQEDGRIGFLYEETNKNGGFDIVYKNLDLKTITKNQYEIAFTGIGSKDTPYVIVNEQQLQAKESVYADEDVNWFSAIPTPTGVSVTDVTYDSAFASWQSVGEGYEYSIRLNGQDVATVKETTYSFSGLQPGQVYNLKISAKKDGRVSLYSEPLSISTIPVLPSKEQLNMRFEAVTDHSATALWNTVQGATYYELALQDGRTYTSVTNAVELTGLTADTEYVATLTAANSSGKSSSHSESFNTKPVSYVVAPVITIPVTSEPVDVTPVDDKSNEPEEDMTSDDKSDEGLEEGREEVTNSFKDIDNAWNKDQIVELYQQGIIKGYSADEFGTTQSVSRIEFAAMLVRAMGYETDKEYTGTFTDLNPNAWYMKEIASIIEHGIAQGNENNEFNPGVEITREQAAKMLYAIIQKERLSVDASNEAEFKDSQDIAAWAKDAVYAAKANGIIRGLPDGNFEPSRQLTRAEAVSLIYNLLQAVR